MANLENKPARARPRLASRGGALALKLLVAAGLIYWLLRQHRLHFSVFTSLCLDVRTAALLAAGALCTLCGLLLTGWRFKLLLRAIGFDLSYRRAFGLTLVGSLFSCALPGLVGGDAAKIAYLCSNIPDRRIDAVAAVVMDRLLGLYSLLVLATLALTAAWLGNLIPSGLAILLAVPGVLISFSAFMLLAARDDCFHSRMVHKVFSRLPAALQDFASASRYYLKFPRLLLVVMIISVLNHAFLVGVYLAAARLLNDTLPLGAQLIVDPAAMTMNVVALTPGGLGITESAFSFLFQAAGSLNGAAVGLMGRLIQYAVFAVTGTTALFTLGLRGRIRSTPPERLPRTAAP